MTDREMMELAAVAAGYDVVWNEQWQAFEHRVPKLDKNGHARHAWVPNDDDGDALRLAIDARVNIEFADDEDDAPIVIAGDRYNQVQECLAPDFKVKTRRAIVRAAAEIGKAMQ